MRAGDYWRDLEENEHVAEEKYLPIWKWSVWKRRLWDRSVEERNQELCKIQNCIDESIKRNETGNYVKVMFLVYCALNVRLNKLWSVDEKKDIVKCGWERYWNYICGAESFLNRSSLDGKPFIARVKVEAGLPLRSFCDSSDGFFSAMKRIWNRIGDPDSELLRWGEEENDKNRFPGCEGAGLQFFQYATELLRNVDARHKETGKSISKILEEEYYYRLPQKFEDMWLQKNSESEELDLRSIVRVKRILILQNSRFFFSRFEYLPDDSRTIQRLEVSNYKECKKCEYDNGSPLEDADFISDVTQELWVKIVKKDKTEKTQRVLGKLSGDVLFFKPFVYKENVYSDYYELVSAPLDNVFPIILAIPDNYDDVCLNKKNLEDFFDSDLDCSGKQYKLYRFSNKESLEQCGVNKLSLKLEMNELAQKIECFIDGKRVRNISLGYPRSPIVSQSLLYKNNGSEQWKELHWGNIPRKVSVCIFKLSGINHTTETEVVVFPKNFHYNFIYSKKNEVCGLNLNGVEKYSTRILGDDNCERTWEQLDYKCHIECAIKLPDGRCLSLKIPSPKPGIFWECDSVNSQNHNSKILGSVGEKVSLSDTVWLRYEPARSVRNEQPSKIYWFVSLYDHGEHLVGLEDCVNVEQSTKGPGSLFVKLPTYLPQIFSATNSLEAKIEIEARILLPGEEKSSPSKDSGRIAKLTVTRYDESEQFKDFFCFGLYNPNEHCLPLNEIPNEQMLGKDFWVKVPARGLSDGLVKWDCIHRIRPYGECKELDDDVRECLSELLKCLLSNDYKQVRENLQKYFKNKQLSNDDKEKIDRYMQFCVLHDIPLSSFWLLQVVLEHDYIACQIPSVARCLSRSSYRFAFDERLMRPKEIEKYNSIPEVKKIIDAIWKPDEFDGPCKSELFEKQTFDFLDEKNFSQKRNVGISSVVGTFPQLRESYGKFFKNRFWTEVKNWEKCVCYIVCNVVLPDESDRHFDHYTSALLCLRMLEIIDKNAVRLLLHNITRWKLKNTIDYHFKKKIDSLLDELKSKEIDLELPENCLEQNNGTCLIEADQNGLKYVWNLLVKDCCRKENLSLELFSENPDGCDSVDDLLKKLKLESRNAYLKQLGINEQYEIAFKKGVEEGVRCKKEQLHIEREYPILELSKDVVDYIHSEKLKEIEKKAYKMGEWLCVWNNAFVSGVEQIALDDADKFMILENIPKCPISVFRGAESEEHLFNRISSFGKNLAGAIKVCREKSFGKMNIDVKQFFDDIRFNPELDSPAKRYSYSDKCVEKLNQCALECRNEYIKALVKDECEKQKLEEDELQNAVEGILKKADELNHENLEQSVHKIVLMQYNKSKRRQLNAVCLWAYGIPLRNMKIEIPLAIWELPSSEIRAALENLKKSAFAECPKNE